MTRFLVAFILFALPTQGFALDKEEVRKAFALERGEKITTTSVKDVFEFERMKLRSDYPNDLQKATKEGQLFVLWVDYEDASLYGWFLEKYPDAIHSFDDSIDARKGITLGIKRANMVESVGEVDAPNLGPSKIKEVILSVASGRRTSPAKGDVHSHTCNSCGTTWWHSSSDPKASHNCPTCGKYQNVISGYPQLSSSCPNGNCANPRR